MKILCAPDSFRHTMTAAQAADAMAAGVSMAGRHAADRCPIADGGEGTVEALVNATGGTLLHAAVAGPRGPATSINAQFGVSEDGATGYIGLSEASGLALLAPADREPMHTTTYGTGQLMQAAIDRGCTSLIVGLGGSATVDGGAGLAQAVGVRFLDARGNLIEQPITGGMLASIARVEVPPDLPRILIRVAGDVTNPLCGEHGAAAVYGPQKGATPDQVRMLDDGLRHLAKITGCDPDRSGFGAAGGAAVGLVTLLGGVLERGIDLVLDAVDFDARCRAADLVLTGEGSLDAQSLHGKAAIGVARAARNHGVPTIVIAGQCADPAVITRAEPRLFARIADLAGYVGTQRAMDAPAAALTEVSATVVREFTS
jgi:glycerate kinase